MDIKDIVVGTTYKWNDFGTVRVSGKGDHIVLGYAKYKDGCGQDYETIFGAEYLSPLPKRYVVELRLPKKGEQYFTDINNKSVVKTATYEFENYVAPVIVEEL